MAEVETQHSQELNLLLKIFYNNIIGNIFVEAILRFKLFGKCPCANICSTFPNESKMAFLTQFQIKPLLFYEVYCQAKIGREACSSPHL